MYFCVKFDVDCNVDVGKMKFDNKKNDIKYGIREFFIQAIWK